MWTISLTDVYSTCLSSVNALVASCHSCNWAAAVVSLAPLPASLPH